MLNLIRLQKINIYFNLLFEEVKEKKDTAAWITIIENNRITYVNILKYT